MTSRLHDPYTGAREQPAFGGQPDAARHVDHRRPVSAHADPRHLAVGQGALAVAIEGDHSGPLEHDLGTEPEPRVAPDVHGAVPNPDLSVAP